MNEKPIKVYTYRRVSTELQIDGYSLSAQDEMLQAYADMHGYQIIRQYSDEGKSGNSILCYPIPHKSLKKFYLRGDNNE